MIVPITQVAKKFGVSNRTIQLWCKSEKIKKIGNEYQLTKEVVEGWEISKAKNETKQENRSVTHRNDKKTSLLLVGAIVLLIGFFIVVLIAFYFNLTDEISTKDKEIIIYKKEAEGSRIELKEITIQKDKEIQSLRERHITDSMLLDKPFYKKRLKN